MERLIAVFEAMDWIMVGIAVFFIAVGYWMGWMDGHKAGLQKSSHQIVMELWEKVIEEVKRHVAEEEEVGDVEDGD